MGKEWVDRFDKARRIYNEADRILGIPIMKYCFEGPEETLTRTLFAQPAIYVTSFILFTILEQKLESLKPDLVAGLSLGEFTALTAARALSFETGLRLVQIRAQLMEKAAEHYPGTMVSVVGLSQEECFALAKESGAELANLNATDQFVLSGTEAAVKKAGELAEGMGAKRVIPLKVGGAFHSSLMREARQGLEKALQKTPISTPHCTFVPNVTGGEERDPAKIRLLLSEQLVSPVRWIETMNRAKELGIHRFVEIGPGRVLKGLARKIDPSFEVYSFEKISDLEKVESDLEKV